MAEILSMDRPKKADFAKAEAKAHEILDLLGIDRPPVDPVRICRDLGVRVVFARFSGNSQGVSGFYDADEDRIYVNRDEFPQRQSFTIAHELGHRLLHAQWARSQDYKILLRDSTAPTDCYEQEANAFAAHLLVPAQMLASYKAGTTISELADLFMVSNPVIKNRLDLELRRA
jgi:Zn-dependent peptidase ImmA (M78 family)